MKRATGLIVALMLGLVLTTPALSKRGGKKKGDSATPRMAPEANTTGEHAGVVAYRHKLLEGVAKHFGLTKMILQGKVQGRDADLVTHAGAIHGASIDFVELFPTGSGPDVYPQTDARPTVWSDPGGFEAAAVRFKTESAELLRLAEAGDKDAMLTQFGKVGATCGGCHESFRKDD